MKDQREIAKQSGTLGQFLGQRLRRWDFYGITLVTLLLLILAARLCLWQLDRAEQKRQLQAQLAHSSQLVAWGNAQLLALPSPKSSITPGAQALAPEVQALARGLPDPAWLYRPVRLQGHWLASRTMYLANRPMQGKTGFWVYTPFVLAGSDQWLWVQRGWVPRDLRARNLVPILHTPAGQLELQGQLQGQPSALATLGQEADERTSTGAALRLNIDWQAEEAAAAGRMLPFTLREQEAGQHDGLGRNWDMPPMGIEKHQGYAFQWAGMGLVLLFLYAWFQWWLPWRRFRLATGSAPTAPGSELA